MTTGQVSLSSVLGLVLSSLPKFIADAESSGAPGADKRQQVIDKAMSLLADAEPVAEGLNSPIVAAVIGVAVDGLVNVHNIIAQKTGQATLPVPPVPAVPQDTPPATPAAKVQ